MPYARRFLFAFPILVCLCQPCPAAAAESLPGSLLGTVESFSLPTTDERTYTLHEEDCEFTVICFLGVECPLARVYGPRLSEMSQAFKDRGVRFVGVNSNIQDSMDDLRSYVRDHQIKFPMTKDYDRTVALAAKATRTPEVIVVDRLANIRYRGRIDDQYQPGIARNVATSHELRDALEQLVAGERVQVFRTTAVGCLITLPRKPPTTEDAAKVTYCDQVSRILQKHCVQCHRSGEIGPFVLDDYDEVVGWADMMVEVIDQKRMPPWHASPEHGSFANARNMPESDKEAIRQWVAAGTPFGQAKNLPPKQEYVTGWRLPKDPDAVFEMHKEPFQVPAEGVVEYQYFVVDPKFTEDKWISAAQVIPGNASVVHHCIAFIRPPDGSSFDDFGMLAAYVPGQRSTTLPTGYARRVAAGSRIVFQMHYTPTGRPQTDKTSIGIVFADPQSVTHEVFAVAGIEQEFEIPPNTKQHTVSGKVGWIPEDGELLAIMPHMHLRGRSFRLTGQSSGSEQTLLEVPNYDFNWQHSYELTKPLPFEDFAGLRFEAIFDNSAANPTNPDPEEYVTWGDQTWQEMAVVFLTVAKPRKPPAASPEPIATRWEPGESDKLEAEEFASRYIRRFDKNNDGQLTYRELPTAVRMFSWFDHNRDGVISHAEIRNESLSRIRSR